MSFTANVILCLCAALTVLIALRSFGRFAGISAATFCGMSVAFFAMDPAYSFEVASPADRGTLLFYGLTSAFLVARAWKRGEVSFTDLSSFAIARPVKAPETAVQGLLEMAADRAGFGDAQFDIDSRLRVASPPDHVAAIFEAIMEAAIPGIAPLRITAYSADLPGEKRIWLALQYKLLPAEPHALHIGRRADRCQRLDTPAAPNCGISWFDNGFERIFQISLPA